MSQGTLSRWALHLPQQLLTNVLTLRKPLLLRHDAVGQRRRRRLCRRRAAGLAPRLAGFRTPAAAGRACAGVLAKSLALRREQVGGTVAFAPSPCTQGPAAVLRPERRLYALLAAQLRDQRLTQPIRVLHHLFLYIEWS